MIITPAPELRAQALAALRDEYGLNAVRPGMHQSALSACLTKSYWHKTDPVKPTDKQAVLFAIGFAMERVMLEREHPEPLTMDGVTMTLDTIRLWGPADLKTTRMATERSGGCGVCGEAYRGHKGGFDGHSYVKTVVPYELPDGYKRQAMAYRRALNVSGVGLPGDDPMAFRFVVVHLVEADISAWKLVFTEDELEANWAWYLGRKRMFERMLEAEDPAPFSTNQDYECTDCVYLTRCQLTASLGRNVARDARMRREGVSNGPAAS